MGSNLFNINAELYAIINAIEEAGGEVDQSEIDKLTILEGERDDKLEAYRHVIKEKLGEIETIKAEIEVLNGRINTRNNTIKRLKETMQQAVELFGDITDAGGKKIVTSKGTSFWTQGTESTEIYDEDEFIKIYKDTDLVNHKENWIPNKTNLKTKLEYPIRTVDSYTNINNEQDILDIADDKDELENTNNDYSHLVAKVINALITIEDQTNTNIIVGLNSITTREVESKEVIGLITQDEANTFKALLDNTKYDINIYDRARINKNYSIRFK